MKILKNKFKIIFLLLSVILFVAIFHLFSFNIQVKASTEDDAQNGASTQTHTIDSVDFQMENGASIRLWFSDNRNGLRFAGFMPEDEYNSLMENPAYSEILFGIVIAPKSYVDIYPFNEENLFGENAKYAWEEEGKEYDKVLNKGKAKITNLMAKRLSVENGLAYIRGSLVNLLLDLERGIDNISREFVAKAYIKAVNASTGEVEYRFAKENDNVRSATYISQVLVKYGWVSPEQCEWVQQNYVDVVNMVASSYKVEHYQQNLYNDRYTLEDVETINSTIDALTNFTTKEYQGYTLVSDLSAESGADKVFANNRLVLKTYYERTIITVPEKNGLEYSISSNTDSIGINGSDSFSKKIIVNPSATENDINISFHTSSYGIQANIKVVRLSDNTPIDLGATTYIGNEAVTSQLEAGWNEFSMVQCASTPNECLLRIQDINEPIVIYVDEITETDDYIRINADGYFNNGFAINQDTELCVELSIYGKGTVIGGWQSLGFMSGQQHANPLLQCSVDGVAVYFKEYNGVYSIDLFRPMDYPNETFALGSIVTSIPYGSRITLSLKYDVEVGQYFYYIDGNKIDVGVNYFDGISFISDNGNTYLNFASNNDNSVRLYSIYTKTAENTPVNENSLESVNYSKGGYVEITGNDAFKWGVYLEDETYTAEVKFSLEAIGDQENNWIGLGFLNKPEHGSVITNPLPTDRTGIMVYFAEMQSGNYGVRLYDMKQVANNFGEVMDFVDTGVKLGEKVTLTLKYVLKDSGQEGNWYYFFNGVQIGSGVYDMDFYDEYAHTYLNFAFNSTETLKLYELSSKENNGEFATKQSSDLYNVVSNYIFGNVSNSMNGTYYIDTLEEIIKSKSNDLTNE